MQIYHTYHMVVPCPLCIPPVGWVPEENRHKESEVPDLARLKITPPAPMGGPWQKNRISKALNPFLVKEKKF